MYSSCYSRDIVIASILHDLLEDTSVTYDDLVMQYGTPVADIVKAVTFESKINDKLEQAKDMFQNCLIFGYEALIAVSYTHLDVYKRQNESVIIEYGFADSTGDDVSLLKNNWEELAEAVVRAVASYVGVPYSGGSSGTNRYVVKDVYKRQLIATLPQ